MKPLRDQARQVIVEGRSTVVVPHGSAARNWQALVSRLDAPLPPGAEAADRSLGSPLGSGAWSSALLKLTLWGVLLGGFGGGLALYGRDASAPVAVAPLAAAQPPRAAAPPPSPPSSAQPTAPPPADARAGVAARPPARARRPPPTAAGLAAETSLLARAQSQLYDGAPARAIALLDQHRAEFPHGELLPEREAARVLALCALGRTAEAKTARARFERVFSASPLLARVRAGCAVR